MLPSRLHPTSGDSGSSPPSPHTAESPGASNSPTQKLRRSNAHTKSFFHDLLRSVSPSFPSSQPRRRHVRPRFCPPVSLFFFFFFSAASLCCPIPVDAFTVPVDVVPSWHLQQPPLHLIARYIDLDSLRRDSPASLPSVSLSSDSSLTAALGFTGVSCHHCISLYITGIHDPATLHLARLLPWRRIRLEERRCCRSRFEEPPSSATSQWMKSPLSLDSSLSHRLLSPLSFLFFSFLFISF